MADGLVCSLMLRESKSRLLRNPVVHTVKAFFWFSLDPRAAHRAKGSEIVYAGFWKNFFIFQNLVKALKWIDKLQNDDY